MIPALLTTISMGPRAEVVSWNASKIKAEIFNNVSFSMQINELSFRNWKFPKCREILPTKFFRQKP
jgi:hypothetical protein